jgi:hypothetical protein
MAHFLRCKKDATLLIDLVHLSFKAREWIGVMKRLKSHVIHSFFGMFSCHLIDAFQFQYRPMKYICNVSMYEALSSYVQKCPILVIIKQTLILQQLDKRLIFHSTDHHHHHCIRQYNIFSSLFSVSLSVSSNQEFFKKMYILCTSFML